MDADSEVPASPPGAAGFWAGELGYLHAVLAVSGAVLTGRAVEAARGGGALIPPSWPVNVVFLGLFLLWLILLSRLDGRVIAWLGGIPFALVSMLGVGLLGAAGGIIPQAAGLAPGWAGKWGLDHVFSGAPFVAAMLLLMTNLGLAALRKLRATGAQAWFFSLNHVGLWVVLASAMFGAGDIVRSRMVLAEGHAEAMVVDAEGRHGYLPFGLLLQRFYIEPYPQESGRPGAPKRFAAEVTVLQRNKKYEEARIEVNRPLRRHGWTLYLTNYDLSPTGQSDQCVIEAVRDPWLPAVYAGIFLMLGGAAAMLFRCPFDQKSAPPASGS